MRYDTHLYKKYWPQVLIQCAQRVYLIKAELLQCQVDGNPH
jgi:hypothetical protein